MKEELMNRHDYGVCECGHDAEICQDCYDRDMEDVLIYRKLFIWLKDNVLSESQLDIVPEITGKSLRLVR
jgi:hypothetical protein